MHLNNNRGIMQLVLCLLAAWSSGCGRGTGYERYIPSEPAARRALESALKAWQDGLPAGAIAGESPRIEAVDSFRRPGQRLRTYEVLGEVKGKDRPRCFAVLLRLENPSEEQKLRYYVVGIDPLWVLRQEEYEMMIHWCAPSEE